MLEYNVYIEGRFHSNKFVSFEKYNIFNHGGFLKDLKKNVKENSENRKEFDEQLKSIVLYYFWSKCEYETLISSLFAKDLTQSKKIDAYDQIMLNWNIFENYIWEHLTDIKNAKYY